MKLFALTPLLLVILKPVQAVSEPELHAAFDEILRENVRDERVDYLNIRDNHLETLVDYLRDLAAIDLDRLNQKEQLAYYINLYNATMVRIVIERFHKNYSGSEDEFVVFEEPLVHLPNRVVSLNDLEHGIIRPTFKDPRIHAALVCAARSCPPLVPRAFVASDLEKMLEGNMHAFLNDPMRNKRAGSQLQLSAIFQWYAEDFGGTDALPQYIARYVEIDPTEVTISFLPYSWELNIIDADPGE